MASPKQDGFRDFQYKIKSIALVNLSELICSSLLNDAKREHIFLK